MEVVAIVQARLGSKRLPAKVLKEILGQPMIWHVVKRLRYSQLINKIVVATSNNPQDNPLAAFCKTKNIDFYRGDEDDVLDRYYQAAKLYKAEVIVRITADCPLIDQTVVDKVIGAYINNPAPYSGASNVIRRTYPRGLDTEVFTFKVLEKIWHEATEKYQREHVTAFIYEHPEVFKLLSIEYGKDISGMRWTVDEEADLRFVQEIYRRLYHDDNPFLLDDILRILEHEPDLQGINKNVKQKKI